MVHRKSTRRSSSRRRRRTHRRLRLHYGGSADANLAYTGAKTPTQSNPFLSYTGKGAIRGGGPPNLNPNGVNPLYPNTGPQNTGGPATPFLNPQNTQLGGRRLKTGGSCGCSVSVPPMQTGGSCGCGSGGIFKGGMCPTCMQTGGNCGIPYPDGLVGNPVSSSAGPGYYYPINTYKNDISRDMQTSPPIIGGRNRRTRRHRRGGGFSNFLGQDLVNFGRGLQYNSGSTYNALMGYPAPVNPLPWKDQMTSSK